MKHRVITFAFAACLFSTLAFADNPTDAPLITNYQIDQAVQPENASPKQKKNKKMEPESTRGNCVTAPKGKHQAEKRDPQYTDTNDRVGGSN